MEDGDWRGRLVDVFRPGLRSCAVLRFFEVAPWAQFSGRRTRKADPLTVQERCAFVRGCARLAIPRGVS